MRSPLPLLTSFIRASLAIVLLAACTRGSEPLCVPGRSVVCTGPGGCIGGQQCLPEGDGFGPCECGAPDAGTNADAGSSFDAGASHDGGSSHDAGLQVDAASSQDASVALDAEVDGSIGEVDASLPSDAGTTDASTGDAGARDAGVILTDAGSDGGAPSGPCTIDPHSSACASCLLSAPGSAACTAGPCATPFASVSACGALHGCCTTCVGCVVSSCPSQTNATIDCALASCPEPSAACL